MCTTLAFPISRPLAPLALPPLVLRSSGQIWKGLLSSLLIRSEHRHQSRACPEERVAKTCNQLNAEAEVAFQTLALSRRYNFFAIPFRATASSDLRIV